VTKDVNALWRFCHEVLPGDIIIARRGTKKIIGIGTVTGDPFYNREKGRERVASLTDDVYANFIPVGWNEKEITFDRIVFSFFTIYEIPDEKYQRLVEGSEPDPEEDVDIEQSVEFVLEKYLEDFIVTNFESIFAGRWKLYEDSEGNPGQQYPAISDSGKLIGRIDILARSTSTSTNSYLVIELKKGRESDKVVGQILRYMGWVKDNLCQEEENVKGLIICKDVDERLTYALGIVQDIVQVKRYSVDFQLNDD